MKAKRVLKFLALFYIFLFYDRPFLHMCNLVENLFSTSILGLVFNDYVIFYRDMFCRLTFLRSRMEPFPLIIILQPVFCSICLVVIPRGPRIRPTKLNCNTAINWAHDERRYGAYDKTTATISFWRWHAPTFRCSLGAIPSSPSPALPFVSIPLLYMFLPCREAAPQIHLQGLSL